MNKTLIIIGVVVILVLFGGGAFMVLNRSGEKEPSSLKSSSVTPAASTTELTSLRDLPSLGSNKTCTFFDAEIDSKGTMYIGSGELRGDFETNTEGEIITSHMIQDGSDMYIWSDKEKQGIKVSLAEAAKAAGSIDISKLDLNKKVEYTCSTWTPDPGFFKKPTDVEFQDYNKMMEGLQEVWKMATPGVSSGPAACNICDSVTGDARVSCRKAMKCE